MTKPLSDAELEQMRRGNFPFSHRLVRALIAERDRLAGLLDEITKLDPADDNSIIVALGIAREAVMDKLQAALADKGTP